MPTGHSRPYGPTWDEVSTWCAELWQEHRTEARFVIYLPNGTHHPKSPTVTLELFQRLADGREMSKHTSFQRFTATQLLAAEGTSLRLLSAAVMALDSDKWRAEAQLPLFRAGQ
jgi:hypothetical protein